MALHKVPQNVQLNIRIPEALSRRMKEAAAIIGASTPDFVRAAGREACDRAESKAVNRAEALCNYREQIGENP